MIYPQPKGTTKKKSARFDHSESALPKTDFLRDAEYRAWVRKHRCLLDWWKDEPCQGEVEAAHLERSHARGLKGSDATCVPLCGQKHHLLLDGNSLDFQLIAYLWEKCCSLREKWHAR